VVIVILTILASIALVTFIGQRNKAYDASAKSNARNAVSYVEACYTDSQDRDPHGNAAEPPPKRRGRDSNPRSSVSPILA
jgi:type II secretory pathway pseudopilin PulG